MSKELTEQFFKATLKAGTYYVLNDDGIVDIDYYGGDNFQWNVIKEVLAHVPTYDQFVELTEKVEDLEQDNKCLKSGIDTYESQLSRISEQLKEANEVIKKYRRFEVALKVEKGTLTGVCPAVDYLKKWGMK